MTLVIGGMAIIQAAADATGWRPEELPSVHAMTTKTGCNLRSGPTVNLPIVAVLKPGVRVVVLGTEDSGMVPVAALGWVSKELLSDA